MAGNHILTIFTVLFTLFTFSQAVTLNLISYQDDANGNPEIFGYRGSETVSSRMTEEQFMSRVKAAAAQMYTTHVALSGGVDDGWCPKALTGLTLDGRTIYYHSSVKGAGQDTVVQILGRRASAEVQRALRDCQAAAEEAERQRTGRTPSPRRHINSANCGEIMATNFYTQSTGRNVGTSTAPYKWIVTYSSDGDTLLPPCSDTYYNRDYGCLDFVGRLGFLVCPSPAEVQRQEQQEQYRQWTIHQEQLGNWWMGTMAVSTQPADQQAYAQAYQFYQTNRYWPEYTPADTSLGRKMKRARLISQTQVRKEVLNMLKKVCALRRPNPKLQLPCKTGFIVQTQKVGTKLIPVLKLDPKLKIKNYVCIPDPKAPTKCAATEELVNGKCVPKKQTTAPIKCLPTQQLVAGKCVPKKQTTAPIKCLPTQQLVAGKCVTKAPTTPTGTLKCAATQELVKGKCVPKCVAPKKRNARTGLCS